MVSQAQYGKPENVAWQALKAVFPGKAIHGCSFHWSQALYRKLQQLGKALVEH